MYSMIPFLQNYSEPVTPPSVYMQRKRSEVIPNVNNDYFLGDEIRGIFFLIHIFSELFEFLIKYISSLKSHCSRKERKIVTKEG